ncbi:RNA-binding protein [Jannaschia sp. S6380]|uniref:RNA-binding protein n=1 Tax=Jannaschia sp. S6380 TaxID=2926408 RepID=UPI001FF2EECD|nr:RNA-binding protein [Jannaschia sp. S6380]MCK0168627.1 RNA-binding protein [Jannaschia sp. S6380]
MTRGGRDKTRDEPERRCIVTGETGPRQGLVRFVVGPEDTIFPDLANKLPGRGIYVSATRGALEKAVAKRMFSKGAKRQVRIPDGLVDLVEAGLLKRLQDAIAIARKAGRAIAGYEKVKIMLDRGEAQVLLQATDGSERGKGKLSTPEGGKWIGFLTADELGQAFGRDRVIHAAVASGTLARRIVEEAARLQGIRQVDGGTPAAKKDIGNA